MRDVFFVVPDGTALQSSCKGRLSRWYFFGTIFLSKHTNNSNGIRDCRFECDTYFNVKADEAHYHLHDITLADLEITAADISCDRSAVENLTVQDVKLTKKDGIEFPDSVTTI